MCGLGGIGLGFRKGVLCRAQDLIRKGFQCPLGCIDELQQEMLQLRSVQNPKIVLSLIGTFFKL